ncbi:MAG: M17 family peptidase N-terminal domain-containing protein, partial [Anaerolineales bacterium]
MNAHTQIILSTVRRSEWQGDLLVRPVTAQPDSASFWQPGEVLLVDAPGEERRLVVVLDQPGEVDAEALRRAGGTAGRWLLQHNVRRAGLEAGELYPFGGQAAVADFCEGLLLGGYRNSGHRSEPHRESTLEVCLLGEGDLNPLEMTLQRCSHICRGVNLARSL